MAAFSFLQVLPNDIVKQHTTRYETGKPAKEGVEKNGTWSTGEFATLRLSILANDTDTDFHNRRSTTIVNRAAFQYDFMVEQSHSQWRLHALGDSYVPAISGTIWIDKENSRVPRLELSADKIAPAFPLDTVETAVDFDYVLIGDEKYLLPSHSESISCRRGSGECSRNVIEFRDYGKFTADSSISFGPN